MEYVYAALLLDAAGKEINEKNLVEVVKAAGLHADEAQAKAVAASLKGVNIKDVIKNAQTAPMQAAPAQAPAAGQQPQAGAKAEKKPAESKEEAEKKETEAVGGLASLFGG